VGRVVRGDCSEELAKWAKGKPVNLPIFESDWDDRSVRTQEAMARTDAKKAQESATGAGQTVAVLDGGFDLSHEFLAGHVAPGYDALDDDDDAQDLGNGVNDDAALELPENVATDRMVGHGTFVASIVLAAAPDATILPVRVLDDEGWGTDLAVASGISWAVEHGADVINMSLVLPSATEIVREAVRAAVDAGVVVVTASGSTDDGWSNDSWVARRSVCVGATDDFDVVTPWTLVGPYVQIFAPGVEVSGAIGGRAANSYGRWSGVSFSVPFLSAGAAMLGQQHPDWTPAEVRSRLLLLSAPIQNAAGVHMLWRGRVDLARSVSSD
jgi:subtilisin family serine protease